MKNRFTLTACAMLMLASLFQAQSGILQGGTALRLSAAGANTGFRGLDAVYSNPAGMTMNNFTWGLDIGAEQRFGLSELSTFSGALVYHRSKNCYALSLVTYGFESYRERKLSFSYARELFASFSIGGSFNAYNYDLRDFGSKTLLSFDAGAYSNITPQIALAFQINNPITLKISENYTVPGRMAFSTTYAPSKKAVWMVEFEKLSDREIAIKTFVGYHLKETIQLRAGADITRSVFGIGAAFSLSNFRIVGASSFNNLLGNSPGINIQYTN